MLTIGLKDYVKTNTIQNEWQVYNEYTLTYTYIVTII